MPSLSLAPDSRALLGDQIAQNGTFIHGLCTRQGLTVALAYVLIEQCDAAVHLRVDLGESRSSLTLARRDDTAERAARFIEEVANGESVTVQEAGEYLLELDLEDMLREAIRVGRGTYYFPDDQNLDLDLALVLRPASTDPRRSVFHFEMHGRAITLPLLLPLDRQQAYRMLSDCVQELIANYRSWAA